MPGPPREVMTTPPNRWRLFVGLLALIAVWQLMSYGLALLRPPTPPTWLSNPAIFADARATTFGPRTADVTIYLLSGYACPNCRAMHVDLRKLVAEDGNVRIVCRDWPILGDRSVRATRFAIATGNAHARFDDELMRRGGPLYDASLRGAAARAGIDLSNLEANTVRNAADIDDLIADTRLKANALGLNGTPVLIVGPYLVIGRQTLAQLRDLVGEARAAR